MNIAMLSGWHVHAEGYANEAMKLGANVCAIWDEIPERGKKWAEKIGAKFYDNYEDILKDPSIDSVINCAPTNRHAEILIAAANAGKNIFSEKVLTLSNEDAQAVKEAVVRNKVHFTISFPWESHPDLLMAKRMVDNGELGQITYARVRNCHSGSIRDWLPPHFYNKEQCGGGAMIDLGAHPMYLLQWFLGKAERVVSCFVNATDRPVEDNAVSVIEFENGKLGVSETGFVSIADPFIFEISGTKGYLKIDRSVSCAIDGKGWTDVKPEEIPDRREAPLPYFIHSVTDNTANEYYTIDDAVELTRIMVAAYKSSNDSVKATY